MVVVLTVLLFPSTPRITAVVEEVVVVALAPPVIMDLPVIQEVMVM